jgi:hypothetical protein
MAFCQPAQVLTFQLLKALLAEQPRAALQRVVDAPESAWCALQYVTPDNTQRCLVGHLGKYQHVQPKGDFKEGYQYLPGFYFRDGAMMEISSYFVSLTLHCGQKAAIQAVREYARELLNQKA